GWPGAQLRVLESRFLPSREAFLRGKGFFLIPSNCFSHVHKPTQKEKKGAGKAPTRHKPPPPHKKTEIGRASCRERATSTDGSQGRNVTGVRTCALPISGGLVHNSGF